MDLGCFGFIESGNSFRIWSKTPLDDCTDVFVRLYSAHEHGRPGSTLRIW